MPYEALLFDSATSEELEAKFEMQAVNIFAFIEAGYGC